MKTFQIILMIVLTYIQSSKAQSVDIAIAAKNGISESISIDKFYGKKLKVGIGIRTTAYSSGSTNYITAPAMLTSGRRSLAAFFTPYKNEKLDTLKLPNSSVISINTKLSFEYNFKKSGLGFNIDVAGVSFGKMKSGNFKANESQTLNNTQQNAKPTPYNFLLISDSDRGSLNSELYFKQNLKKNANLRLGLSFQFIEYQSVRKLTYDNDRFRFKTLMPFVAFTFKPFQKTT